MGWKNWSYTLRGGIIGIVLSLPLVYYFITGLFALSEKPEGWGMIYMVLWWIAGAILVLIIGGFLIGWAIERFKTN